MKKSSLRNIAGLLFGVPLALIAGCSSESASIKPFIEPCLEFQGSLRDSEIANIPAEKRYVPIHPVDTYARESNNGPIPKDTAKLPKLEEMRFAKAGIETRLGRVWLDTYADVSYRIKGPDEENEWKNINERNYTNHPGTEMRDVGAALTYYKIGYSDDLLPGFKADLHVPISEDIIGFVGAGYRKYGVDIKTGWDRWGSLEEHKTRKLTDVEERSVYGGVEFTAGDEKNIFITIKGGAAFNRCKDDMQMSNSTNGFASIGIGYKFR
jgi:hypothetical protein